MNHAPLTRRSFAKQTGFAAMAAAPAVQALGANERIQLGMIGLGGRGSHHLRQLITHDSLASQCKIVALADPDMRHVRRNQERLGHQAQAVQDFRKVLDNPDVDAVYISTPDHWHAIMTILACQAGKDVYVEKPMTHTIEEALRVLDCEAQTGRVIMVGQQQRSQRQFQRIVERIQQGDIGSVNAVRCLNMWGMTDYLSEPLLDPGDKPIPPEVDYDLWLGPAPERPFSPARFHVNFYFFLDYSGGMITGWGVHLFDIVMWAMGPTLRGAYLHGGKFVYNDLRDTPDTAEMIFDAPDYTFSYLVRHGNGFPHDPREGNIDHGIYFYGEEGTALVNRRHAKIYPEPDMAPVETIEGGGGDIEHKQNFFDCIRSRNKPVCPPEDGFYANLPGQLAIISWQLKRHVAWDPEERTIPHDDQARALMSRDYRAPWTLPEV